MLLYLLWRDRIPALVIKLNSLVETREIRVSLQPVLTQLRIAVLHLLSKAIVMAFGATRLEIFKVNTLLMRTKQKLTPDISV